ncbi:MAG: DedD protein [Gammaproteobacteria bacterium]|jgi:DedD protein
MDQQIKERMVGAGVLVLAAVIFIPMLLSGAPPQSADPSARAGGELVGSLSRGSAQTAAGSGFSSRIVPVGAPSPGQSIAREAARPAARKTRPLSAPAKADAKSSPLRIPNVSPSAKPSPQSKPQPKSKPKSKPQPKRPVAKGVRKSIAAPSTTAAVDGWVVQLGSFSSSRNAHALRDRLKSKGYKAFARSSGSGAQAVTRIYVGPDAGRERAQQRVSRLLAETRLKGIVIRNPK